jgi:hypothetical protein
MVHDRTWLRRRIDRTEILSDEKAGWESELEILLPQLGSGGPLPEPLTIGELPVPLVVKNKELLTAFDVLDAQGAHVQWLTSAETAPILNLMVFAEAQDVLTKAGLFAESGFDRALQWYLLRFVGDAEAGKQAIKWLTKAAEAGPPGFALGRDQAAALCEAKAVHGLLAVLSEGFPVLVPLPNQPYARHVLQITHEEATKGYIRLPAGSASSYHAELACPEGVRLSAAVPIKADGLPATPEWRSYGDRAGGYWNRRYVLEKRLISLIAIHAAATRQDAVLDVSVREWLRIARGGLGLRMRVAVIATASVFSLGALLRGLNIRPLVGGGGATLLIALLSVYVGLLAVSELAPTQRQVTSKPRLTLIGVAVLTASAAACLAVTFPATPPPLLAGTPWGWRAFIWCCLAVMSVILASAILLTGDETWWRWRWQDRRWRTKHVT